MCLCMFSRNAKCLHLLLSIFVGDVRTPCIMVLNVVTVSMTLLFSSFFHMTFSITKKIFQHTCNLVMISGFQALSFPSVI